MTDELITIFRSGGIGVGMSDLIRREDVAKTIQYICDLCGEQKKYDGVMCGSCHLDDFVLNDIPSAEPERKKGKWVEVHGYVTPGGDPVWKCSECGKGIHVYGIEAPSYNRDYTDGHQWVACPNCGAEMDSELPSGNSGEFENCQAKRGE